MTDPYMVRIGQYPQLRAICWNRREDELIPEDQALALYERLWFYVDEARMGLEERAFLQALIDTHGRGVFVPV